MRLSEFERGGAVESIGAGVYRAEFPDGWQQGRGCFGGLVLAALLRAIEDHEPDRARVTRSLAGELCGPVLPGPAEIRVEALRRGSNLSNLDARLVQNGEVLARASAVLSLPRAAPAAPIAPPPPVMPPWQDVPVLDMAAPRGPVFASHVEFRPTGPLPFTGGELAEVAGFVRMRDALTRLDAPNVVGLLDAWWPALFSRERAMRMIATVGFTAQLLAPPGELPADAPLFHVGKVAVLRDGFFVEFRELWSGERLVAMNQQTFAVLR